MVIAGANVVDQKLLEATIEAIVVERPQPKKLEQNLCLDKGYDNPTGHDVTERHGYIASEIATSTRNTEAAATGTNNRGK